MRILFADSLPTAHVEQLAASGHEVIDRGDLDDTTLVDAIAGVDVLVVRSTKVTAEAIDASDDLSLIIRAGAGVNTIDTHAAAARGIYVCNVPGRNAVAVAELTMGLVFALDRNIPDNVADLRDGRWDKKRYSKADGLFGKTIAIIGLGSIGLEVASRASAFGMRVLTEAKPDRDEQTLERAERAGVTFVDDRDAMLGEADIVTLHVPLNDATRDLVDEDFLAACKDGAWILNTSRGGVVDGDALLAALEERGMRAGLDVFPDEPAEKRTSYRSDLSQHPAVYGTHHIGASTTQAQEAIADEVIALIGDYARGVVRNCVNLATEPVGTCSLTVRHLDRVGVLSEILGVLKSADVNVGQMENRIFAGSEAAVATITTQQTVSDEVAGRIADVEHVIGVRVNRGGDADG